MIEKAAAEKFSEKEIGTPGHMVIGTGPWKFDNYQPEASIQMSRNPYWNGTRQPAEKIAIDLFKTEASMALAVRSHAIDGAFGYLSPRVFANIPDARMLTSAGISIDVASANTTSPPFNDVHVRRALAYASDTAGMIKAFYPSGTATQDATVVPASLFSDLGSSQQVDEMLGSLPKSNSTSPRQSKNSPSRPILTASAPKCRSKLSLQGWCSPPKSLRRISRRSASRRRSASCRPKWPR